MLDPSAEVKTLIAKAESDFTIDLNQQKFRCICSDGYSGQSIALYLIRVYKEISNDYRITKAIVNISTFVILIMPTSFRIISGEQFWFGD